MSYREKPHFIIKKNLQKSATRGVYFSDVITSDVLKDVCNRVIGRTDYTVDFVDNSYSDEYLEATYNKGRMAILEFEDTVFYISFSEADINGRNSSVQSVPTAYNIFYKNDSPKKHLCYYFLNLVAGNAETDYLLFMYRLMNTIGFRFLNADDALESKIAPFNSIEDIIFSRRVNSGRNRANNSTYITKSESTVIEVYGKTYGANKYESAMICYALSFLALKKHKLTLYEVWDNSLKELPQPVKDTLLDMGKMQIIPTDMILEKKAFEENDSLRSPRFIYNLFDKYGTKKCALCNCEIPEIIQGAHIWPVASIKKVQTMKIEDKLKYATDGENGIWLCENHHKLFDENFIRFNAYGEVKFKDTIDKNQIEFMEEITTIPYIEPEFLTDGFVQYLEKRYKEVS